MATIASALLLNKYVHVQVHPALHKNETKAKRSMWKIAKEFRVWEMQCFPCINALDKRQKPNNTIRCSTGGGCLVQDGLVYRQNIAVRSFEIGYDRKLSLAALTNYLQDTALNHCGSIGLLADGFGSTPEMSRKNLIWVVSTLQILVYHYPSWLDVVQVDTWMYPSGQIGLGREWLVRDVKTGDILAQATSVSVLMNKITRKLSKFTKEIREELASHLMKNFCPIFNKDSRKMQPFDINKADYACTGLKPGWNELDLNYHVNHVQYINWILKNVPCWLIEHHKLSAISLEYRKECDTNSILQSLSKIVKNEIHNGNVVELEHLLLLENGLEIAKGSTIWKPRDVINFKSVCSSYSGFGKNPINYG